MRNLRAVSVLAAILCLAACGPEADMSMQQRTNARDVPITNNQRVSVTRIGVFKDDLAYEDKRGVYLIKDSATGAEFIGISGIGISELGSHQSGKTTVTHEQ